MSAFAFALILFAAADAIPAPDAPTPSDQAAAKMTLPDGFHATLFAGEPDVVKPIAMTTDDRGRLWVAESHSYPHWITDGKDGKDRILIFEDRKSIGHFESCKVFSDHATNLSGVAVGFGGVWLCSTPNLLFIPLKPNGDEPAGPPVVVLDGWDLKAKHNVFNQLVWGPDGWLYGCNGILSNSRVGKPGTPDAERTAFNCGVWRYHPTKKRFEVVASGTTNPWGLDFDERGEAFITNCVIKHLFHVIPGAHYERMYGQDLDADSYGLMESCADHIHWAGGAWTSSRGGVGAHGEAGGGHAHAGAMIYLGDNWPDAYRGHIFMCNLHGNRVNQDVPERVGSGYVAHHGKDFLFGNDPWFRGLALMYGPDGGVYVSDWCDTGECHNYTNITPTTGRIYKVTYGKPVAVDVDVAKLSDEELVRLQLHKNEWWARHARRILQERANDGKLDRKLVQPLLVKMLSEQTETPRRLRALWALYGIGGLDEPALTKLLDDTDETVRGWAVRLLVEDEKASEAATTKLAAMAHTDKSASVRLALASALQRLPAASRWPIAEGLTAHEEDAKDANLPLMIWYGIEGLVPTDPDRAAAMLVKASIPLVREYIARRIAAGAE
jgi:putative membrane-bound dehydrogenase-like protein